MLEAAYNAPHENYEPPDPRDVWSAMLAAAPAPEGMRSAVWALPPILVAVRDLVEALPDDVVEAHAEAFNRVSEALEAVPLEGLRGLLALIGKEQGRE